MFDIVVSLKVLSHDIEQSTAEIDEHCAHAKVAHYDAASVQLIHSLGRGLFDEKVNQEGQDNGDYQRNDGPTPVSVVPFQLMIFLAAIKKEDFTTEERNFQYQQLVSKGRRQKQVSGQTGKEQVSILPVVHYHVDEQQFSSYTPHASPVIIIRIQRLTYLGEWRWRKSTILSGHFCSWCMDF